MCNCGPARGAMSQPLKRRKVAAPLLLSITARLLLLLKCSNSEGTDLKTMHRAGSGCSVASNGLDQGDSRVSSQPLPRAASLGWQ